VGNIVNSYYHHLLEPSQDGIPPLIDSDEELDMYFVDADTVVDVDRTLFRRVHFEDDIHM
jgi:hypothetical protein